MKTYKTFYVAKFRRLGAIAPEEKWFSTKQEANKFWREHWSSKNIRCDRPVPHIMKTPKSIAEAERKVMGFTI